MLALHCSKKMKILNVLTFHIFIFSLNTCVKLSNLSNSVTQRTLEPIISRFGKVDAIEFTAGAGVDKDSRSAIITYQTKEDAEE